MFMYRSRRWGIDIGLAGAAAAAAGMLGTGVAHADTADDVVAGATASGGADTATGSAGSLGSATTNFTDASSLLSGIDVSDLPGSLQLATTEFIGKEIPLVENGVNGLTDLQAAEDGIVSQAGSSSGTIEQLFFDPLNQDWTNASEAVLNADEGLNAAVAQGSDLGIATAEAQLVGDEFFQVIPAALESDVIDAVADLFGGDGADGGEAATAGPADIAFGLF